MDPMYNRYQNHMDCRPIGYPTPDALTYMNPPFNNWHWGTGYPYPPVPCHGCCNYPWMGPPYSHIPPPYYPPFPTQCAPPPHYNPPFVSTDHHCCGCPNHLCNRKEQKSVRIEEEPEGDEINKIAPDKFENTHPVIWFPTDTKEHQRNSKHVSADAKHNPDWNTDEKQPLGWFGWYPSQSKGEMLRGQEANDGKGRFPFPAYQIPYIAEESKKEEPTKKHVVDPKLSLEPVKDGGQPRSVVKDIPVKELKPNEENVAPADKDRRDSSIKEAGGTKEKLTKNDPKTKSSSPPKSSKLPPVCLRVDPLPRKKVTTGSSRSSAPSEDKKRPDQVSNEVMKAPSPSSPKEKPDRATNKECKEYKGVTKAIKVVDGNTSQEKHSEIQTVEKLERERVPDERAKSDDAVMKLQSEDTGSARAENGDLSSVKEEAKTWNKPKLSEVDAAVIIQSAYRGFDIRRWEPVKKLKEVAKVREEIAKVSELVQALKSSSDIQTDSKQKNIIAETIMSLLLKLDTMQGLHPSIKEVRKSVVRELVSLQEEVDALISEKSKAVDEIVEKESVAASGNENVHDEAVDVTPIPSHDSNRTHSELVEPCLTQLDAILNKASDISEKILVTREQDTEASEVSESFMPECSGSEIEPTKLKVEHEESSQTGGSCPTKEGSIDSVLGRGTECSVDEVEPTKLKVENEESSRIGGSSPAKEDGVDSVLGRAIECSVAEVVPSNVKPESEQPLEVAGDLLMLSDAERAESGQAKQPDEGMEEAHISGLNHDTNKRDRESTESYNEFNVPLGEINTKSDATEIKNAADGLSVEGSTPCEEFETTKQVDSGCELEIIKQVDSGCDPDGCSAQSPKSVYSDMFKSPAVVDQKDNPIAEEAPNVENANISTPRADLSVVGESPNMLPMKEYEAGQEPSKQSADSDEKADKEISSDINVSDQYSSEQREEAESEQVYEEEKPTARHQEHFPVEKNCIVECTEGGVNEDKHKPEMKSVAAPNVNQGSRDDEKLMEENEKLRDMVDRLVKSGEEQLRVISSLCGRVKHLERNLSKKRKLKMKPVNRKSSIFERVE